MIIKKYYKKQYYKKKLLILGVVNSLHLSVHWTKQTLLAMTV